MTPLSLPRTMVLCYEERHEWEQSSALPMASEAARSLAPRADIDLALDLTAAVGIEPVCLPLTTASSQEVFATLKRCEVPMMWNITDGLTVFRGSLIPSFARILKIPALGSDTYVQGLCQNKHHWRAVLEVHGINCLPGVVVRKGGPEEYSYLRELKAPLFVKAATYGNNAGFSVVDPLAITHDEAFAKACALLRGRLGPVLVEEYAAGNEYSVWCFETQGWDAVVYEKVMDMPYLTTAAKDKKSHRGDYHLVPREARHIARLALDVVSTLDIHDYVRLDVREDENGDAYPIDINTGAFLVGRSFELACRALRGTPREMFLSIVAESWRRQTTSVPRGLK